MYTHKAHRDRDSAYASWDGGAHLEAVDARVEVGEEARVQLVDDHDRPLPHVRQKLSL